MRRAIATILIAAAASTAACSESRADDPGPSVSRDYRVGAFRFIEVAGPHDVTVRTGAAPSVTGQGGEKALERMMVEVKGDRLVIRSKDRKGLFRMGWSGTNKARFVVTVPELAGAALAGSGDVRIDKVRGEDFQASVAGSGELSVDTVDVGRLKLATAGSGELRARAGTARTAEYEIAGSGGVDAGAVTTEALDVSIAGSGNVSGRALRTAKIDIAGSGNADISGGARCQISKVGSGNASCS
jgi:hypothetical protein